MIRDKKAMYFLLIALAVLFLLLLVLPLPNSKLVLACVTVPAAAFAVFSMRKKGIFSIHKRLVCLIMGAAAVIWLVLLYLSGLYFGLYWSRYFLSLRNFFQHIAPIALSIIATEIIRSRIRAQHSRVADVILYFICVLSEVLLCTTLPSVTSAAKFMDLVGLTLIPAISGNLLYHYVAKRYGAWPNITLRLLLSLYSYFIPFVPATPDAFEALCTLALPLLLWLFLRSLFDRRPAVRKRSRVLGYIGTGIATVLMISVVMIISCQFWIGMLVVGTGSMTGELNIGDAVIYERYDDQTIQVGDVIVFQSGNARIIHRVVEIEQIGGELRYITKGDANEDADYGYRINEDITGIVKFKIAYIGYPTIWIRDAFTNYT